MNDNNKDHFDNTSNNAFENKLFRKNAFKEENNLLPKSLLKDLIEDESSSDSLGDSPIHEKDSYYPKNFDSSHEGLENQTTNAFSNYTPEEPKLRASTFNEVDNARKSFKIAESFGANTNNKLFKVQSYNEYQNFSRPKINNLSNMNTINNLNTLNTNNSNNLNNLNNNNLNNNNNYFNVESRNFCDEQPQGFMGKIPTMQSKQINSNNNNPNMQGAKLNSFNALARASSINQNNNANNFNCNMGPQKPMNNMRFNPMPGRSNFPQQASPSANFNCQGCVGGNPNCYGNNCFSDLSPNNYAGCNMGKKVLNQICLCPNCDDSAYLDENSCAYYPQNMNNGNNMNNFGGNCINSNANMLGGPQPHGNYMNFGPQQQQFEKNNLNQCRTFCNMNVSHPNIGLGSGMKIFL